VVSGFGPNQPARLSLVMSVSWGEADAGRLARQGRPQRCVNLTNDGQVVPNGRPVLRKVLRANKKDKAPFKLVLIGGLAFAVVFVARHLLDE
jgi:hypothetical protein